MELRPSSSPGTRSTRSSARWPRLAREESKSCADSARIRPHPGLDRGPRGRSLHRGLVAAVGPVPGERGDRQDSDQPGEHGRWRTADRSASSGCRRRSRESAFAAEAGDEVGSRRPRPGDRRGAISFTTSRLPSVAQPERDAGQARRDQEQGQGLGCLGDDDQDDGREQTEQSALHRRARSDPAAEDDQGDRDDGKLEDDQSTEERDCPRAGPG